tara:strand:- start:9785 stop:9949 length:165 start_codon:yes stop_codon:yes gene_type:complete
MPSGTGSYGSRVGRPPKKIVRKDKKPPRTGGSKPRAKKTSEMKSAIDKTKRKKK